MDQPGSKYPEHPTEKTTVPVQSDTDNRTQQFQTALAAEKKKRRTRPWLVVLLSLLLMGVGAASAVYVYKSFFEKPAPLATSPAQDTKPTDNKPATVDAAAALAAAKKVFPGSSSEIERQLFALQVPGYTFNTDLGSADDYVGVSGDIPAAENAVKLAEIGRELKALGMTEDIDPTNSESSYVARYKGADAVCIVTSSGSYDNRNAAHAAQVACANMAVFKKVAAAQKPLYEASKNSLDYNPGSALYGAPTVKDSPTAGYKTAEVVFGVANLGAGASMLMFYQAPDSSWHYVTGKADVGPGPQCSEFKTEDAKKAYAGTTCYNELTPSKVQ